MHTCLYVNRGTCICLCLAACALEAGAAGTQQIIPFNLVQFLPVDTAEHDGDSSAAETNTPHVFIFGSTQLSSSEEAFNTMSASGKFQAMVLPSERFGFTLAYNAFGVNPNTIAKDSLDVPTLMFPDAGNTGFMVAAFYTKIIGKQTVLSATQSVTRPTHCVEFSLRNTKIKPDPFYATYDAAPEETDSSYDEFETAVLPDETPVPAVLNFTSRNVNIGTRLDWLYVPQSDPEQVVQTGVCVYVNFFSVPKEDAKAFLESIDKTYDASITTSIKSLGFKTSFSYKGLTVFGDFRWNVSPRFDVANTPLEGFIFNIGTALNVELLSF
ncbi:MAG TPA: hypothetical protein VEY71_12680 [Chitinophagales bacterium]|nr:hypothetical protein [Chitinophagales bacterium]